MRGSILFIRHIEQYTNEVKNTNLNVTQSIDKSFSKNPKQLGQLVIIIAVLSLKF